jgi:hypothetical protein
MLLGPHSSFAVMLVVLAKARDDSKKWWRIGPRRWKYSRLDAIM